MNTKHKYIGLSDQEVLTSREKNGKNLLTPPERDSWVTLLLEKFEDPIIRVLLFAVFMSFGVQIVQKLQTGHWELYEPIGIVVAVFLATFVGFINEFKAGKEFDVLNQFNDTTPVTVIRNGNHIVVPKDELVVGDIIVLETGMEIPADGDLLEVVSLQVSESKLTGESVPVTKIAKSKETNTKNEKDAYEKFKVLNGTTISTGHGIMEVTAVGDHTEIGKTARASMEVVDERTPLEQQLDKLADWINVVGFAIAGLTFAALAIKGIFIDEGTAKIVLSKSQWLLMNMSGIGFLILLIPVWLPVVYSYFELRGKEKDYPKFLEGAKGWIISAVVGVLIIAIGYFVAKGNPSFAMDETFTKALNEFLVYFMIAITLIVVAVPEGLPMATTISLAYSMRKMMKSNVLTKKMLACETIGAITTICTDKTGTLTMNEMRIYETQFTGLDNKNLNKEDTNTKFIAELISSNSTANLHREGETAEVIGNPTEGSLILWLEANGMDYEDYRDNFRIINQIPFTTENKYMATAGRSEVLNKDVFFVKGAPEIVVDYCTKVQDGNEIKDLASTQEVKDKIVEYQKRGMRTLGFAYKEVAEADVKNVDKIDGNFVWLGFVAINDPIRPEVPEAIKDCRMAGIEVKIVTGDNPLTAAEIGNEVNIEVDGKLKDEHLITGVDFAKLEGDKLTEECANLKVLARAKPHDKLTLVKNLKKQGKVVAVTGDGTNDAPAMNYANVGLAMGKTGTSVAKEAADMVLLDDSFTSIVRGVMWGRSLYQNIQRFILFQLTINVAALLIALIGPFIGVKLPLTIIQLLWVNLIMDTFGALALATEPPHKAVMKNKPRKSDAFIISKKMAVDIFGVGFFFVAVLMGLLVYYKNNGGLSPDDAVGIKNLTIFFSVFVLLQFWNMFNARIFGLKQSAFKGLKNNKAFLAISLVILFGQILMVQYGNKIFRTTALSVKEWLIIIASTSLILWIGEIRRLLAKK